MNIEKGIEKRFEPRRRNNGYFLTFNQMEVNDSFALPFTDELEAVKLQNKICRAKRNYSNKYNSDFTGSTRIFWQKKEIRFWRDK